MGTLLNMKGNGREGNYKKGQFYTFLYLPLRMVFKLCLLASMGGLGH